MATIRNKKNGRKPYVVDYRRPDGVRKRKCFATRSEADRFRIKIEEGILRAKEGFLPDGYVRTQGNDPTVGELYEMYCEKNIELKKKWSAQESARNAILGFVRRFEKRKASALTPEDLDDYHVEWIRAGKAELSFQVNCKRFIGMLRWGKNRQYIGRNPLERFTFENGAKAKEKQALSEDSVRDFKAGLERKEPRLVPFLILGVNTGMRISEMLTLTWDQIDIERRQIYIPAEKNKTNMARTVPLNDDSMAVIQELHLTKPYAPYVLWHAHEWNFVTPLIRKLSKSILGRKVTPHHWRVTFATRGLHGREVQGADGKTYHVAGDLKSVAEIGGWKPTSPVLLEIYSKVSDEQKRATVNVVDFGLIARKKKVGSFGHQPAQTYPS